MSTTNTIRRITARFDGACKNCGTTITAGDEIDYSRETGPICAGQCPEPDDVAERQHFEAYGSYQDFMNSDCPF
jgi:hypothetical protein